MRKFAVLLCVVLSCVAGCAAQEANVSLGYNHLSGDPGGDGWYANGGVRVSPMFDIEADLGGFYSGERDVHTFLFGPKLHAPEGQFRPFAHLLLGAGRVSEREASSTDFTWLLGVGGDVDVYEQWGGRVFADLVKTRYFGEGDTHLRVGFGVVYRFGE